MDDPTEKLRLAALDKAIAILREVYPAFTIVARYTDENELTAYDIKRLAHVAEAIGLSKMAALNFEQEYLNVLKRPAE